MRKLKAIKKNTVSKEITVTDRKFNAFNSIRIKMIFLFLLPVLFIILLGIASYRRSSDGMMENYEASTLTVLDMMSDYYSLCFDMETTKGLEIVSKEEVKRYYSGFYSEYPSDEKLKYSDISDLVANTVNADPNLLQICILGDYGKGVTSDSKSIDNSYYRRFMDSPLMKDNTESSFWVGTHPVLDELDKQNNKDYGISNIRYLYSTANKPIGVLAIDISYDFIYETLQASNLPKGSIVGFITTDGREIVYGDSAEGFSFGDLNLLPSTNDINHGYHYMDYKGNSYLYLYSIVDQSSSIICAMVPKEVIAAQAEDVKNLTVIIVILATAIAIISGFFLASSFWNAIKKANETLSETASGNLTVYAKLNRKDEFMVLAQSINHMIDHMRRLIIKNHSVGQTIAESANNLNEASKTLVLTTKTIHKTVHAIEGGISEQAAEAEHCYSEMNELSEQINMLHENAEGIGSIAEQSQTMVADGLVTVNHLNETSRNTSKITKTIIEGIHQLESESNFIASIVETINGIAAQTNLLALNASIEAARAGDAGKGFAVVAEEIRKLAEQSADATQKIQEIMSGIQQMTKDTAEHAMDAEDIIKSQEVALHETIESFKNINHHVDKLSNHLAEITDGIFEIDKRKQATLLSIETISATSQETAAATAELAVTANDQLKAVEDLNRTAEVLDGDSKDLEDNMKKFTI